MGRTAQLTYVMLATSNVDQVRDIWAARKVNQEFSFQSTISLKYHRMIVKASNVWLNVDIQLFSLAFFSILMIQWIGKIWSYRAHFPSVIDLTACDQIFQFEL